MAPGLTVKELRDLQEDPDPPECPLEDRCGVPKLDDGTPNCPDICELTNGDVDEKEVKLYHDTNRT